MLYLKVKSIALHMDKAGYAEFVRLCREHAEASAKDEGNIKFEMKYVRLPFAVKVTFLAERCFVNMQKPKNRNFSAVIWKAPIL